MSQIQRTAYFAQSGLITANGNTYCLPIMSANISVDSPIEKVNAFGQFSSFNTAQTNLTTVKSTLKTYLGSGYTTTETGSTSSVNGLTAQAINDMIAGTQAGTVAITVSPNGFGMTGILDNLSIDISMGGFAMADLSFAGVGHPSLNPPGTAITTQFTGLSLAPVTTLSIGTGQGALSGVYASSIKFSYSLPTDVLSALGDNPDAYQANMVSSMASKPPYTAKIDLEGHGIDPTVATANFANAVFDIGNIGIALPHAKIVSRSFTNAAGQVSASYSYSMEDTSAVFTTGVLGVYVGGYGAMGNSPTFGA